ncbi:hypothetical protein SpCBS45565_g02838 [Spizellomyces sp. 'palustris']|nr:hypothetical protein SpCBS45565_g02838 [Spizellomyces sp. 'palustris']
MSSYSNWNTFEEEEEEEEQDASIEADIAERDNVIFAVDATLPMHETDKNGISHVSGALRCAARFLQNKIVQSESDLMGLVFFGTNESHNEQGFKHIYVQYDLDVPDVDRILDLEKLANNRDKVSTEIGSSDEYSLAEVFWTCSNLFSAGGQKVSTKRIFLITHNDSPHAGNLTLQRNARVRAQDLQDLGISIELFPVEIGNNIFKFDVFFQDLPGIVGAGEDSAEVPASASRKYEEMQKKILRRETKKRTTFRVPLHLHEGLTIGVKGYNLVLEQRKGNYTYLDRRTNAEVRTVTTWACSATAQSLLPPDMKSYWVYGGQKVVFTKNEVNGIKHFGDPGLVLLGFKDRHALKFKYNVKHAAFIYPDESEYTGSTSVFAHFLEGLSIRGKIAICRLIARRNAAPRLAALLPQKGCVDKNGDEIPCGFHVIYLPFEDDNRRIPASTASQIFPEHTDLAKEIVHSLVIKNYDAANYENPVLQKHYNNLQAIALRRDFAEEIEDTTLPRTEAMHKRAGDRIRDFKQALGEQAEDEMAVEQPKTKRAKADDGGKKRSKGDVDLSESAFRAKCKDGKLSSFTVAQLSEFLLSKDRKPAKKKSDLIGQIEEFFEA